ncbi:hypothetical protein [Candidatus Mycoplasma haematominutum]|uniref:hypothetical protein n=1 Tax=Candidatus Mycoplasma haematominutum TaxID=209446 RepID=UPI001650EF59|nr:hypothetical protein [Candidatus Mycoplasma haematominutum]
MVELIETPKSNVVYLRWLFGATTYFSIAGLFFWILGLSSIHMSQHMKDKNIVSKIFFFATPTVWKHYVIGITGGFFNILRKATYIGEKCFIFFNMGLIASSFANLALSLSTINLSSNLKNQRLRYICLPLCFPALGSIASFLILIYLQIEAEEEKIREWAFKHPMMGKLAIRYFEWQERREGKKHRFKPKTIEFMTLKKKPKTLLDYMNQIESYALNP